jgi:hypothetical protein
MTPEMLATIFTGAPNFVIALWVIWNYQRTIDKLLQNQQSLLNQLMALHPPQGPPTHENHE